MIMIEIQYRSGSRGLQRFHGLFASDRPITSLYKLLFKNLGKLKSVYYHTTRVYNKTLTFTSFYFKIIGNYVILY